MQIHYEDFPSLFSSYIFSEAIIHVHLLHTIYLVFGIIPAFLHMLRIIIEVSPNWWHVNMLWAATAAERIPVLGVISVILYLYY